MSYPQQTSHQSKRFRPQAFRATLEAQPSLDAVPERRLLGCRERVRNSLRNMSRSAFLHKVCMKCNSKLLHDEKDGFCCGANGTRRHRPWPQLPPELTSAYSSPSFGDLSRIYNSLFCSAILHSGQGEPGFNYHQRGGPPAMRFQGTLYARMMRTAENCWFISDSKFGQGYSDLSTSHKNVALHIAAVLSRINPLSSTIVAANDVLSNPETLVHLPSQKSIVNGYVSLGENTDADALCAVYLGPGGLAPTRTISHAVLGSRQTLREESPIWESLLYPLYHPTGSIGSTWRPFYTAVSGHAMTLLDYLRSVMWHEPQFWRCSRLAHQYILDTYARSEQISAKVWASDHVQLQIRNSIMEITGRAPPEGKIFLPASVPGSFKYQQRFMHDAMHITGVYGNPHLFLTMTANTNWPEITALLPPGQKASDRPDIINRVFVQKRKELMSILNTPNSLFEGHVGTQYVVSVSEFQKCSLIHTHMAVRLRIDENKVPMHTIQDHLNLMDRLISAQLPEEGTEDYDLVCTFMLHNSPCDERCQRKRKDGTFGCRFYYPKKENPVPRLDRKGFAQYKRGPNDARVVPHIILLLRRLKCHVNAEWTFGSGCVGYMYKYFAKPVDSTGIKVSEATDEICAFRSVRLLTASEAVYRTLGFNINFRDPPVTLCRFTVPKPKRNEAVSDFLSGEDVSAIIHEDMQNSEDSHFEERDGDLKDYFDRPPSAENYTFTEYFAHFYRVDFSKLSGEAKLRVLFDQKGNCWMKRKYPILARMHYIPRYAGEAYYLRLLLLELIPRSYGDLYGRFTSFRDHVYDLGLEQSPLQNIMALREAITEGATSKALRRLYVLMAIHCGEMGGCWDCETIKSRLIYDFQPDSRNNEDWPQSVAETLCIMDMISTADNMGHTLLVESHGIPKIDESIEALTELRNVVGDHKVLMEFAEHVGLDWIKSKKKRDFEGEVQRHWINISSTQCSPELLLTRINSLNQEQSSLFATLRASAEANTGRWIHIDAPAGCGKSYVCETFLKYLASNGEIGLACASTGIAALQFEHGRTAHNLFKLPLNQDPDVFMGPKAMSQLTKIALEGKRNARIELLRATKCIVWDEIGMIHKVMFEAVDDLLRAVMSSNQPFGGKLFITLGDWRQICPVDNSRTKRFFSQASSYFSSSAFQSSILSSKLWFGAYVVNLSQSERFKDDAEFGQKIMQIGNGVEENIEIATLGLQTTTSFDECIGWLFEHGPSEPYDPDAYCKRAFVTPFNSEVDTANEWCCRKMEGFRQTKLISVKSRDSFAKDTKAVLNEEPDNIDYALDDQVRRNTEIMNAVDIGIALMNSEAKANEELNWEAEGESPNDFATIVQNTNLSSDTFTTEFLRRQDFPGVPPHCLLLCPGMIVVLLRNLDHTKKLLNGTRLVIVKVGKNIILARHAGEPNGDIYFIPRIKFDIIIGGMDSRITRYQYPVRAAYAITIHKSQACTLDRVVLDLRNGVFDHGQLYVALSRVRTGCHLLILLNEGQTHINNIVFSILLEIGRSKIE